MRNVFTSESARENGRKGNLIRWSRAKTAQIPQIAAVQPERIADYSRKERMVKQIDLLDNDIEGAKDPGLRCKLIAAKARLWELLYPKPGSLRPKTPRASMANLEPIPEPISAPTAPLPIVNESALVVPENTVQNSPVE